MITQHDIEILSGGMSDERMEAEINHMIYLVGQEIAYSNGLLSQYHPKTKDGQKIYPASLADISQAKQNWDRRVWKMLSELFNGQEADVRVRFDMTKGSPAEFEYDQIWNEIHDKQNVLGDFRDDLEAILRKLSQLKQRNF